MSRRAHVDKLIGIYAYLDKSFGKTIVIDSMIAKVNTSMEIKTNWLKSIYGQDMKEEIPTNIPLPLENQCQ